MWNKVGFASRHAVRGLTLIAVSAIAMGASAIAQPRNASPDVTSIDVEAASAHQSLIRITDSDGIPVRKNIKIGLGKSVLVEFPRDIRDVMVSNPATVDAVVLSSNRVFLLAKNQGEANAFFFDTSGEQFATMEIFIERETSGLDSLLNRLIPGSSIKVELLNQTVILTGSVKNPTDASRAGNIARQFITQQLTTFVSESKDGAYVGSASVSDKKDPVINLLVVEAEEQVMLKVTVAEVQRTLLKQMGINLGGVLSAGNFATTLLTENALPLTAAAGLGTLPKFGISTAGDPTDPAVACGAGSLCAYNAGPGASTFGNSGLTSGYRSGNDSIRSAIRALERDGLIRTLAEPNLTAISGESAEFLAGGEIPYVKSFDVASGTPSVDFKPFGVQLSFTPTVLSEGRISMKIDTSVSEISSFISGNPVFDKRQAKTVVELPSGGSLALAGLISSDTRQNIDGLPGAKDIPILGTLFRSRDFINKETELVVIVTPYLVQPVARQKLATPADGLYAATDMKANFLGQLNRIYGKSEAMPDGGLKGDYGFIVE